MKVLQREEENKVLLGPPDFIILIIALGLTGMGLLMVYSSSMNFAFMEHGGNSAYYFTRQLVFAVLGVITMYIAMKFPYEYYKKLTPFLLFAVFVLMLLVMTPLGHEVNGARRWLNLGFTNIQPSEFVKIALIIYLASIYSRKQEYIDQFWRGVIPPLFVVGLFFGLILFQRDLGTAMSLIIFTLVMLFCSGARFKHMFALGIMAVGLFAVFGFLQQYRLIRIMTFLDPWADRQGAGYQLVQSLLAIGNGGLTGSGFNNSIQKQFYLPEAHTDFIFSIFAEEFGLIGVTIILLAFLVLIIRGIQVSTRCPDAFGTLLGLGIVSMIGIQTLINVGVASGSIPVTGITLPFISYGGSSLLLTLGSIGILLNISRHQLDTES